VNRRDMLRAVAGTCALVVSQAGCPPPPPPTPPGGKATPSADGPRPPGTPTSDPNAVTVVHWANEHMMNKALLPKFAEDFYKSGIKTAAGKRIQVKLFLTNSGVITTELIQRVKNNVTLNGALPNPTLVTPAADHWIGEVNAATGQTVVDMGQTRTFAVTWIGIVTYEDMARCLGWPDQEVGLADIVALRANPAGWSAFPTSKIKREWRKTPLLSFTDPSQSSTARSMLYALYSIAANKQPADLTLADVATPEVVNYIKQFQRGVDHYVPNTLILNSKAYQGPTYGQFYFMVESNLVQLYQGKMSVTIGPDTQALKLQERMVMIYPREGSIAHNHSADLVQAPWVTPEQTDAARMWTSYLLEAQQQQAFMEEGFRPAIAIPYSSTIGPQNGLDPSKPTRVLNPDTMKSDVAMRIVGSWEDVKKPGMAVFVVDISGSMAGRKLDATKEGLRRALSAMPQHNSVGLVTFNDQIRTIVEVDALAENGDQLETAISGMLAAGQTALYDAVTRAIQMVDTAPGDDNAIRGVVILTDGQANAGTSRLRDVAQMEVQSTEAQIVSGCSGFQPADACGDGTGQQWTMKDVRGAELRIQTSHRIKIFFVGISDTTTGVSANWDVCRILAGAAQSECKGATNADLAAVIETFGKYF
jgi:Ca-activated chloride channel homolog